MTPLRQGPVFGISPDISWFDRATPTFSLNPLIYNAASFGTNIASLRLKVIKRGDIDE